MAIISTTACGIPGQGQFVVNAWLKVFGPNGIIARHSDQVEMQLQYRGREYVAQVPRRVLDWQGGSLQILWQINYSVMVPGDGFSRNAGGRGHGNILQSWRIERNLLPAVGSRPLRPVLIYIERPTPALTAYRNQGFEVTIAASQQNLAIEDRYGEVRSRLNVRAGLSENSVASVTVSGGGAGAGIQSGIAISRGGSFSCSVVVPYAGG